MVRFFLFWLLVMVILLARRVSLVIRVMFVFFLLDMFCMHWLFLLSNNIFVLDGQVLLHIFRFVRLHCDLFRLDGGCDNFWLDDFRLSDLFGLRDNFL